MKKENAKIPIDDPKTSRRDLLDSKSNSILPLFENKKYKTPPPKKFL